MATTPEEEAASASTDDGAAQSARRTSELDLTKAGTGPVWRQYLRAMGPGLITGASDDDPSGIAAYSQAGAKYGQAFLWAALVTWPLMVAVQEICDRTALATGTGLGELAVKRFQRGGRAILGVLLVALVVANALNIAADLVAVGYGMRLLRAGPTWIWALVAGGSITMLLALGSFARIASSSRCAALRCWPISSWRSSSPISGAALSWRKEVVFGSPSTARVSQAPLGARQPWWRLRVKCPVADRDSSSPLRVARSLLAFS